jgi:hypothetical protein
VLLATGVFAKAVVEGTADGVGEGVRVGVLRVESMTTGRDSLGDEPQAAKVRPDAINKSRKPKRLDSRIMAE